LSTGASMEEHRARAGGALAPSVAPERLARMPRQVYPLRVLGMGLGGLAVAAVLYEQQAGWPTWALCALTTLAWPHVALWLAVRSANPYRTEVRNLLFDSALAGLWAPLMHFDLLPSVLLLTLATVDKISTGIPRLWLYSLPAAAAGLALGLLMAGPVFEPHTSMTVMLACLPMLLIHTVAVSLAANRLIERIRRQNRELDLLHQVDALTGLYGRRHWHQRAEAALRACRDDDVPATLLMVDIDRFKEINDEYGHACGDDVLRMVAAAVRQQLTVRDSAGRYGGDEFAVVLGGVGAPQAQATAERIRQGVEAAAAGMPHMPGLRCSVSVGLAQADPAHDNVRDWIEAADAALYAAKHAGRNRVVRAGA